MVDCLLSIDGVDDVHHVHLWQMQEDEAALDLHVVVSSQGWPEVEAIKGHIKRTLRKEFGINHSTLEFEQAGEAHRDARLFGHAENRNTS